MRAAFFLKEAIRALSRNASPSLAAMLTILLTAVVLGVFIPIVAATTGTADQVRGRVLVDVYVEPDASRAEIEGLRQALATVPNVRAVEYIPKAQALAREKRRNPDAFELLGANPLPDAFRLTPADPGQVASIANRLAPRDSRGRVRPAFPGIDEVRDREEETEKILSATALVKLLTGGLALLLLLASVALVANTIRLSVFARRREVEVMRLVGATNWFIRWPFVIEGVIVGCAGGVMAVGLLAVAKATVFDPLAERFALLASPQTIDFQMLALVLVAACVAVSALGSGLTLRRFLKT